MPEPLLLAGTRVLATTLLTAALCTAATVAVVVAAGEVASAAWLGMLGTFVGLASGLVAGLAAAAASALATWRDAPARVQRWVQPLAGGLGAGTCAVVVLSGAGSQRSVAAVALFFVAAAAVAISAAKCSRSTVSL